MEYTDTQIVAMITDAYSKGYSMGKETQRKYEQRNRKRNGYPEMPEIPEIPEINAEVTKK